MGVTLVEKQIRTESGSLMQNPTAHDGAFYDSSAESSGPAGILSTAQTIEKSRFLLGIFARDRQDSTQDRSSSCQP